MFDNARLLDQIERAIDTDPFCPACHAPNTVIEADDSLWIVCSATLELPPPSTGWTHRSERASRSDHSSSQRCALLSFEQRSR